tara:strand:+ start:91 stop:450 length:360 start_codon:yes stop_codon:yes gene_type:complete
MPAESEEAKAFKGLQDKFVEFVAEQAKKQKNGEEVLIEFPKTLANLFTSPEAVRDFDNFFDSFKVNEDKGTIAFKCKHSTSRRARDKESSTSNFADQPGMKDWKKNNSSYANSLKAEKK